MLAKRIPMRKMLSLCLLTASAIAGEYGFSDYYFADPDRSIHLEGRYRRVGSAQFETHRRGHLTYSDAYGSATYTHFLGEDNSLSWEAAYNYLGLDWEKNSRFKEKNFNYAVGSIGYVSTSLEKWRWLINAGFSVDASHFDFGRTGVYHGMLWGRYQFNNCCGFHMGVMGWIGIQNGYTLPIFGVDWKISDDWAANIIYPVDFSLTYSIDENWAIEGAYSSFGGPYRYPRRAHEGTKFHDPIFLVYSQGGDLNLKYRYDHLLRASIGGGWNAGGWILVRDSQNHHGHYYHFNSAFYGQGTVAFTF